MAVFAATSLAVAVACASPGPGPNVSPDAIGADAMADKAGDGQAEGQGVGVCILGAVSWPNGDQLAIMRAPGHCDLSGCWFVDQPAPDDPLVDYGAVVNHLVAVHRWTYGSLAVATTTFVPPPGDPTGSVRTPCLGGDPNGALVAGGTFGSSPNQTFACWLPLAAAATPSCVAYGQDIFMPNLIPDDAGGWTYLAPHKEDGALNTGSAIVNRRRLTIDAGKVAQAKDTQLDVGSPTFSTSAVACGSGLILAVPRSCRVARYAQADTPTWVSNYAGYALLPPGGHNHCEVAAADPECTIVLVSNSFVSETGGDSAQSQEHPDTWVALDGATGKVMWQRPLSAVSDLPAVAGAVVDSNTVGLWVGPGAWGEAGLELVWLATDSGHLVGLSQPPMGKSLYLKRVASGHKAGLVTFTGWAPKPGATGVGGLADNWGNTTCETSGSCWQKAYTDCTDQNPCTSDLCDAAHSGCYHVPLPDGITCSDAGGHCAAGLCK